MTDKVATTLFKYTVNVQEFLSQNERVRASVVATLDETKKQALSVEDAGKRVNRALAEIARSKGVSQIAADFHTAERAGVSTADSLALVAQRLSAIGASEDEIRRVAKALTEQAEATERVAAADSGQRRGRRAVGAAGRLGQEIRMLPAIGLGGNLSTDAIGKILYTADAGLTALGATAAQVGTASLIAAPAVIALVVALKHYNDTVEAGKKALTGALGAQDAYYEALSSKTSSQAAQELEDLERRAEALAQQRQELEGAIESAFNQAVALVGDAGARTLDALGQLPTAQLRDQLNEVSAAYELNIQTSTRYRQGLEQNAFALNDQRERVEKFADRLSAAFGAGTTADLEGLVQQREYEVRTAENVIRVLELHSAAMAGIGEDVSAYNEQIDEQRGVITDANQDIRAYNLVLQDSGFQAMQAAILAQQAMEDAANAEAARMRGIAEFRRELDAMTAAERDALQQRLQDEAALLNFLAGVQYGEELERTNAALQTVRDQLDELGTTSDTTADRLARVESVMAHAAAAEERRTDAAEDYLDAVEDVAKAQAELAEATMALALLEQEHAGRMTEIALERQTREQDAEAEASQARIEAAEEFERQRLQIERRSNAILSNAIAARDALAFYLARQKKQEELDNLKEAEDERLEKIDDSYKKQLKAAELFALRAAENEQARYDKQLQIQRAAADRARVDLENAKRTESYVQQYYAQLSINTESQRQTAVNQVMAAGLNASLGMAESWAQSWTFAIGYGLGVGAIGGAAGSGGTGGSGAMYQPTPLGGGRAVTVNAPINITGGGDSSAIIESALRQLRTGLQQALSGGRR